MAPSTVHDLHPSRKPQGITHYAYLGDTYGTAELLNGSGYLFRAEGERTATLISYKDTALMVLGLVALAAAQQTSDIAAGGFAQIACSRPN
jgi:hypothetical protein